MLRYENVPIVNFVDTLRDLQDKEWKSYRLLTPEKGQVIELPDGREDILGRLWNEISSSRFGNQVFNNDSIYRYIFPTINGEPMSEDLQKLYDYCKEAIINEELIFKVSW
jgi:hypothetical protein